MKQVLQMRPFLLSRKNTLTSRKELSRLKSAEGKICLSKKNRQIMNALITRKKMQSLSIMIEKT